MSGPSIGAFVVRRLLWAVFLLFAATVITYVFFWLVPADPATFHAASQLGPQQAEMMRHFLHLDQPVWKQYLLYVQRLLHGSLGNSLATRQDVGSILGADAPVTGSLLVGAAVLWLGIAIPAGTLAGLRPRSVFDRGATLFVLAGLSAPAMWLGLVLSYVVGYRLHLTPIAGYCNFFTGNVTASCDGPLQWAYHLILPWTTFMFLFAALYMRMVRAAVLDAVHEDHVRTARAKGAPEMRVVLHHVLRNSIAPVVTMIGLDAGTAIFAATITETVFGLPGLGHQAMVAYGNDDEPVIMGLVMLCVVCVVVLNFLVDVAYALLDPRVRMA